MDAFFAGDGDGEVVSVGEGLVVDWLLKWETESENWREQRAETEVLENLKAFERRDLLKIAVMDMMKNESVFLKIWNSN